MTADLNPGLALFDFDGTITTRDTFVDFMKFSVGRWRFYSGFIIMSPWAALYFLKVIPGWRMKERALAFFYRGLTLTEFNELGRRYANGRLPRLIRKQAAERLYWHLQRGHQVVIVTASLAAWIEPWCRAMGLSIVATKPELKDGRLTGRLDGLSCVNDEKRRRILELYDPTAYSRVYAYGDTSEDLAMLSLAQEKYFGWQLIG